MAMIGMRHVVAAAFPDNFTEGSAPTYASGFDVGGAISANLTKNRNTNGDLYYDDALGESDQGLISLGLELGVDDLTEEVLDKMGILKAVSTGSPTVTTYYETSANPKALGIGYMRVRQKGGTISYQAIWIYKMQFTMDSESAQTKGESVQWQTPTVTGKGFGIKIDSGNDLSFREIRTFTTESAASTYLDGKAGITRT